MKKGKKVQQNNNEAKNASRKQTNKFVQKPSLHDIYKSPNTSKGASRRELQEQSQQSSFTLQDRQAEEKLQNKAQTVQKVLNRLGLEKPEVARQNDQELQMLVGNIVENCVGTIDSQSNLEHYEKLYNSNYKEALKGKKRVSSITVNELTEMEQIQMIGSQGFSGVYKEIRLFLKKISNLCCIIVQHNLFQTFILLVIILNSIKMALDDPLTDDDNSKEIQAIFLVIYTLEMVIKIFAFGFLFNQKAYLRDLWNLLDFVIVVTSLLPYIVKLGFSVNSLRAIRVLRPLKTITKVKSLKMIVSTLFYSFSLVMDSLYLLFFAMIIFAIAGQQLFSGALKNRCIELETGIVTNILCIHDNICSDGYICGKGIGNPNFSIQNFDTFLWSILTVFQTITLEGWSQIMVDLQACYSPIAAIYSLIIIFFCEYVILNMTMAILKYKYSQVKDNTIEEEQIQITDYQPEFLKKLNIFKNFTTLALQPPLQRYFSRQKTFVGSFQFNKQMQNNQNNCMQQQFKPIPATHRSLGRIKTINLNTKTKKFDLAKLSRGGKIEQAKWDPKTLQFQSLDLYGNEKKHNMDSIKHIKNEDDDNQSNKDAIQQQNQSNFSQSFSLEDDESCYSQKQQNQVFMNQKIYEMQMKLNQSKKNIDENPFGGKSMKTIANPLPENRQNKLQQQKSHSPQAKQMNQILSFVKNAFAQSKNSQSFKIPNKINLNNIVIPQINFSDYKVDNLYEKFNDLGEYRIKRLQKINQLNFFNIKQQKKHNIKLTTKQEANTVKQMTQQSSLDIKQLQLVNQLIKKKMKCRIKQKELLDQLYEKYEKSRVMIFNSIKQTKKKSQQMEFNLKNLATFIMYKQTYFQGDSQIKSIVNNFARNYDQQYKGLRITYLPTKTSKQQKNKMGSQRSIKSNAINYMKMLQNHKMQQKVDFEEQKLMNTFFKKQKELKTTRILNKFQEEYKSIKQSDIFNRHGHIKLNFPLSLDPEQESSLLSSINIKDEEYHIYMRGIFGIVTVLRKKMLLLINKPLYDNFMLMLVLANTVILSLNGLVNTTSTALTNLNFAFTIIFAVDLGLKIFAYGFEFFNDIMNLFDSFVVTISIVELTIGIGGANLSALRSIRILRAFRVLRVTRLIRSLSYMKIVMQVVSSVITQFVYIFMLLALFIFIYTLLGMQIMGGNFLSQEVTGIRQNFDTFFNALFSVFQVLTVQNWNDIQTAVLTSSVSYFGVVYLISWIFIGNWILLSLLQAILLDGFDADSSPLSNNTNEEEQSQPPLPDQKQSQSQSTERSLVQDYKSQDASLLLFYPSSFIRRISLQITTSKAFQIIVVIVIALSSFKLAIDTYVSNDSQLGVIFKKVDIAFNCIFICESVLKIISRGFIVGQNAYLKDNWSRLDFLIVCISIVDMSVTSVDLSIFKLFRTLRPLRIVSKNTEMKIILSSLAQSMCGIMNVLIIILCVFLMFGILGINLLQGKLNYCNPNSNLVVNNYGPYNLDQDACLAQGGVWTTQFINFENILNSLLSLYVFSTRQNWPYYVFSFIDSSNESIHGPVKDQNQILYFIFAVIFIFVCSYFFMDLLVGVLFMNFHEAEAKQKPKQLTDKQINWKNLQKIIIQEDPCFQLFLQPDNIVQKLFYKVVTSKIFEFGIVFCILANILVMVVGEDDQSSKKTEILSNINFALSIIFILEMLFKMAAFGKAYFLSGWHIFDFFVVMASILDLVLSRLGLYSKQSKAFSFLPQIARIFRVMRVTRLLRMFKKFKGLQKLLQTFIFSLPALGRGLSIVCLFFFITSILASFLLSSIESDFTGNYSAYRNFDNFHQALTLLYINTSGQNWYYFMFESIMPGYVNCTGGGTGCVSYLYLLFWLPTIFLSQKVFMELFVLIVLDQFESNYIKQNNPLGIFAMFEDDFRTNWIDITVKYNSQKIQTKRLLDLLLVLRQPLGLGRGELVSKYEAQLRENEKLTQQQIQGNIKELELKLKKNALKLIQKMDIKSRLYLGYHQTFYQFAKLALMPDYMENATDHQKGILQFLHKQSEEKLMKLMPEGNNYQFQEQDNMNSTEPLNPIQLVLFSQMIIKSWHNYSVKFHVEKTKNAQKNQEFDSLNNSCASDVEQAELQKLPVERKMQKRKGLLETGMMNQVIYEHKPMPNIDDHYQNEKKRFKKMASTKSNLLKALPLNALQRFASTNSSRKTQNQS